MKCFGFVILASVLFAGSASADSLTLRDDAGRFVSLASPVTKVISAGPPADWLLAVLAPGKTVGLVKPFTVEQRAAFAPPLPDIPAVPRASGQLSEADYATIKATGAALIIDYGDMTPAYMAQADKTSAATGLPVLMLDASLDQTPRVLRQLGRVLGNETRAEALAKAVQGALDALAALSQLSEAERVPVYYGRGADGLTAAVNGGSPTEAIRFAGGRTLVERQKGSFRTLTADEVKALAPAVVIVSDASAAAAGSPLRIALPASTLFLVDEHSGFHLIENPPSINRLIGALWLAPRIHGTRSLLAADAYRSYALEILSLPLR